MTPQEQMRKAVDALSKQAKLPTGGDGRITAEAINTSAIARNQAGDRTRKPPPPPTTTSNAPTAVMRKPPPNYAKMVKNVGLGEAFGIGTGVGGFVKGMVHSDPAQARVLDVTQTREYRDAQSAAQQGLIPLFGENPKDALKRMEGEQAQFDEEYRQMTGASSPTEQRILRETNRFNPRFRR